MEQKPLRSAIVCIYRRKGRLVYYIFFPIRIMINDATYTGKAKNTQIQHHMDENYQRIREKDSYKQYDSGSTLGTMGSSITIQIIIYFQNQLAKLLSRMQKESQPHTNEVHNNPNYQCFMKNNPFLCPSPSSPLHNPQIDGNLIKIQNEGSQAIHAFQGSERGSSSCSQSADGNSKKTSIFHNFQKHLITTLKSHITFQPARNCTPSEKLMISLWRFFIKSNKPTKKYLYSLLMNLPQNLNQYQQECKDKTFQAEFQELLRDASQEEIRQAQSNLRFHLMRQSKRLLEEGQLNHRRMHKLNQFKQYFGTFIQDLESGQLNLRLPKRNRGMQPMNKKTSIGMTLKKQKAQ